MADRKHNDIRIGDKFIIEIGAIDWSPQRGYRFWAKNFNTLCFDDNGIDKLKKYEEPKKVTRQCCNCKYKDLDRRYPPCSVCDCNYDITTKDMFEAK